jgi:hypothetical protein
VTKARDTSDTLGETQVDRPPRSISRLLVPDHIVAATLAGLRLRRDREGLVYWAGRNLFTEQGRETAVVMTAVLPKIESDYDHFRLLDGEMARISEWCAENSVWILAQVHSHPADEPHSEADETWPASQRLGFLSVVVPFFAEFSTVSTPFWEVYELTEAGWTEITSSKRIEMVPTLVVTGRE